MNERVDKSRSKLPKWRRLAEGEIFLKKGKEIEKAPKKISRKKGEIFEIR